MTGAVHPELVHFVQILPEPGLLLTRAGEILSGNRAASALAGVAPGALSGARLHMLVTDPPERVDDYLGLCARSRQLMMGSLTWQGRQLPLGVEARSGGGAAGAPVETRCDGAVLQPRTGEGPAILFLRCRPKAESTDQFALLNQKIAELSSEILERRKAEHQRDELLCSERAARLEAERISRVKDEFLATLSHELRTPLNAILGWAQLLKRDRTGPENITAGLHTIERNARAQSRIIDDLLDMSRIISGKVRLDVQRVELPAVIDAAIASVRPAAEAKGIRLQVTLDPVAGPTKGDPSRLQQVVWNLLTNAIKFTPKGGRVQVFLERVNSHVEIVVSDTGEGIRPEFLPHVFDRFRQADASTTRRHGGLGLGLSIVKQLVELHGGSVRAKSPGEGQGATFSVVLPLLVLHEEQDFVLESRAHPRSGSESAEGAVADLHGLHVLVVDDEPDARELMRLVLEGRGAEVAVAASGGEALHRLAERRPDVLISDVGMPGMDGYELARHIREMEAGHRGACHWSR